jgi:hypothetical protein
MGNGIDLARAAGSGIHGDVIEDFKDQLLIVLVKRLGGNLSIPVAETDDTGGDLLFFSVQDGAFHFEIRKKQ